MIESDDPLVQRSGTWTYQDTPSASGGGYLYSTDSANDVLELNFTGTTIDIIYVRHPSLGRFSIEIDNTIVRTVNSYSEETEFGAVSSVSYLDDEPHVLRVYPAEGVIAIDLFVADVVTSVSSTPTPPWIGDTSPPYIPESYTPQTQGTSECEVNTIATTTTELFDAVDVANDASDGRIYCIYLIDAQYIFEDTLVINSHVRIFGRGYPNTRISTGLSLQPLIGTNGIYNSIELHHLQIEHGRADPIQGGYGGGIQNYGTLGIYDSRFTANYAAYGGGAIINHAGNLTVQRSVFEYNTAGGGGAIQNTQGTVTVSNTCFSNNSANYAGAYLNAETGSVSYISESDFQGNQSTVYGGGAIYNLATPELDASMNSWSTGSPTVNNATPSVDSVSERVNFNPVLTGPADCVPLPPYPIPSQQTCVVYVNFGVTLYGYPSVVHPRTEVIRGDILPLTTLPSGTQTFTEGHQLMLDVRYIENDRNYESPPIVRVISYNLATTLNNTTFDENDGNWHALTQGAFLWINSAPIDATIGRVTPVDNLAAFGGDCSLPDVVDRTQLGLTDVDLAIEELRDYGVEIAYLPPTPPQARTWSDSEILAIRDGVQRTAQALQAVTASNSSPEEIFRTVMVGDNYIMFVRLPHPGIGQPYSGTLAGSCQYHDSQSVNGVQYPVVVACNGYMSPGPQWETHGEVLEEAVVHELGHVFDNRVGLALSGPHGALQEGLPDDNGQEMYACIFEGYKTWVMGYGEIWERGHYGWGSPMPVEDYNDGRNFQQFIQNFENSPVEAGADMFLNWVYRRTTSNPSDPSGPLLGDPCLTSPNNNSWQGFLNIKGDGSDDPRLSGNVRYWWMDETVINLLAAHGWSGGN